MDRKYSFDVLPSGNLSSELVEISDTGYFYDLSLGESSQQTCHEITTNLREEPPGFDKFRQDEPDECGDSCQKEPPKRSDSPQKPPECDDLPQEEAQMQPPSPPTLPPSLSPSTTYTMSLSNLNEPTSISPEITGISQQMADISRQMQSFALYQYISPQTTSILPQMIGISPQMTAISPQIIYNSPQMTAISPQIIYNSLEMNAVSPQIIGISPQITAISPHIIGILPQIMSISPQMTYISPQITSMSPQKMPGPVPVPHAKTREKPRKSWAKDRKNGYNCDFPNCNKVYMIKKSLIMHKKLHTGEQLFLCTAEGCTWRFARVNCFNRHIRSKHSASKPFHCRHCDKSFARSDYRAKHETLYCTVGRELQRKNQ